MLIAMELRALPRFPVRVDKERSLAGIYKHQIQKIRDCRITLDFLCQSTCRVQFFVSLINLLCSILVVELEQKCYNSNSWNQIGAFHHKAAQHRDHFSYYYNITFDISSLVSYNAKIAERYADILRRCLKDKRLNQSLCILHHLTSTAFLTGRCRIDIDINH